MARGDVRGRAEECAAERGPGQKGQAPHPPSPRGEQPVAEAVARGPVPAPLGLGRAERRAAGLPQGGLWAGKNGPGPAPNASRDWDLGAVVGICFAGV